MPADQSDILAQISALKGDETKLTSGAKLPANLVEGANEISRLCGELAAAKGDQSKLVAGATVPTDLVSAANTIADLTAKLATANGSITKLEGEKVTADKAVADRLAALGITDNAKAKEDKKPEAKLTLTEKVLKARGVDSIAALNKKMDEQRANTVPDKD